MRPLNKRFSQRYLEYLASSEWKMKVADLKALHNWTCQMCHRKSWTLTGHHLHYRTFGNEDITQDLQCLCKSCHEKIHKTKFTYDH